MHKYLIINLNLFTKDSAITLITDTEEVGSNVSLGHFNIDTLPEVINNLANEYEITDIKIAGNSKFAPLIEYGIKQAEMVKYNKNNLNIEVI